ncbi:hypothetical protein FT663_03568 [Candidozyma haemuli var. vulneris]|uniref:GPI transamidase component GPI17 n=1 Tax=Candidozyma haemuli TaxID=45357 RepID=A0A2V1ASL3_9ASCO|nr:hypothetical protein CXQ85_001708 [[Candida] haemuloni]KAF3987943.1 hypothetical protein FT662_03714 [[Candida] haemuloni var. vulneris]KAF3989542.1 hypothetical protein FT663_03568 [[Candida] haemuloni var. vulneris]PVH19931.1 hypothetical protein CXQ85_001708 [[Candida] haemuloni]
MKTTHESEPTKWSRRSVVWMVFAFVLFLGAPMFIYTTSTYRADLPVEDLSEKSASFSDAIQIRVPVYLRSENDLDIPTLQEKVNNELQSKWNVENNWGIELISSNTQSPDPFDNYVVDIIFDGKADPVVSPNSKSSTIHVNCNDCVIKELIKLFDIVFEDEVKAILSVINNVEKQSKHNEISVPHASTYNIVFNLFVENGISVDWEIDEAVSTMQPIFDVLRHYTNFKVSSQIQYYTKLHTPPVFDNETNRYIVPTKDLSTFINYGDWNLITHDIYPTINFIVFFPASNQKGQPLILEHSKTNSFIVPQWGGVYIYNAPMPVLGDYTYTLQKEQWSRIFDTFASQLLELIGIPKLPKSLPMRIDSFNRIMGVKNLKHSLENLKSLVTLSDSLDEISIPELTRAHMVDSLHNYGEALKGLQDGDFASAVRFSSKGLEDSDKAFFEKEMVQQAYFPSEHKLAVFLPLLGPLGAIVVFGLLGVVKEQLKERKQKAKELQEKKDT